MQAPKQTRPLLLHAPLLYQALAWAARALAVQQHQQQHCLQLQSFATCVASGRRHMPEVPFLQLLLLPALPARYCLCGDACQAS
jgi:hypothetical protein